MKTINKFLITCGLAASVLPLTAADCFGFPTDCETDADCVSPEVCNEILGVCEGANEGEGEGEGEGEEGIACGTNGDLDDSACLEDRDTSDAPDPLLCDGDFCEEPQELTGGCTAAADHTDAGGPVVYNIENIATGGASTTAGCDNIVSSWVATVYSEEDVGQSLNSQELKFLDEDGDESTTAPDADQLPEIEAIDEANLPGYYTLSFFLCGSGDAGAIFLKNDAGVAGNAACIP